jgi:hypothetical protein
MTKKEQRNASLILQKMRRKKLFTCIVCGNKYESIKYKHKDGRPSILDVCQKFSCRSRYYARKKKESLGLSFKPRKTWYIDLMKELDISINQPNK